MNAADVPLTHMRINAKIRNLDFFKMGNQFKYFLDMKHKLILGVAISAICHTLFGRKVFFKLSAICIKSTFHAT